MSAEPPESTPGPTPSISPPAVADSGADAVLPVTVGTVAWAIALVVLLALRDRLEANGAAWWIWVCVTGLALGLFGCWWVRRRRALLRRRAGT